MQACLGNWTLVYVTLIKGLDLDLDHLNLYQTTSFFFRVTKDDILSPKTSLTVGTCQGSAYLPLWRCSCFVEHGILPIQPVTLPQCRDFS